MSGREGKCAGTMGWGGVGRGGEGRDPAGARLSVLVSHAGGKKKPLKQPKKQAKEMDEVRAGAEAWAGAEGLRNPPGVNPLSLSVGR